jgi:hypothetical protein
VVERIASSARDCSRCTVPIAKYQLPMPGSRGLRRMARSMRGRLRLPTRRRVAPAQTA